MTPISSAVLAALALGRAIKRSCSNYLVSSSGIGSSTTSPSAGAIDSSSHFASRSFSFARALPCGVRARISRRTRRRGRVAEGGGLLNRYTLQRRIEGSNPSVSASRSLVMAGLVPAIHDCQQLAKTWMPATSAGMTGPEELDRINGESGACEARPGGLPLTPAAIGFSPARRAAARPAAKMLGAQDAAACT